METSDFNQGHKGIAPEVDHVRSFFSKRHCPEEEADLFYYYYQSLDWSYENGLPVRDWKLAANEWLFNLED